MKELKSFLIKRLLCIFAGVFAAEMLVLIPVRKVLLPAAFAVAEYETGGENIKIADIIPILKFLLFGGGQAAFLGMYARSLSLILLLVSLIAIIIPFALGLLIYSGMAASRVNKLIKQQEAEHAEEEAKKNLMLSDLAHDLRTPITTVSGYARALKDGMVKDEEKQQEYLDAICRKSDRMSELITLLFDYAKLGSAEFRLNKTLCDINELTAEVVAGAYTEAEDAGMTVNVDIPEERFPVMADSTHAGRILNNLFINAVRHNPAGTEIGVIVRRGAGIERIIIADTGGPIEKDIDALFDPFVKGDDSRTGDKGTGLGLSVSSKLAEMHGWKLSFEQPFMNYTKAFILTVPEEG